MAALWLLLPLLLNAEAPPDPRIYGTMTPLNRESSYLLAAPHGEFDAGTAEIVDAACKTLNWDCLVARGQRKKKHPINVNRPTEGYHLKMDEEAHTPRAAAVYLRWSKTIQQLNPEVKLYVEVHGNKNKETRSRVEIAAVGVDKDTAARIRGILKAKKAAHGLDWMDVYIEGVDELRYKASSSKRWGELSKHPAALHFEFPVKARKENPEKTAAFLSEALAEIVKKEFP